MLLSVARPVVFTIRQARNRLLGMIDTPVMVLLYHRVAALKSDPQLLAVSPGNFRAQMRYLKERFPIVRFDEDWSHVASPSIAVTFDDGYADNALNALPILEEVGVPATFFVSTGTLDTPDEYWWDELQGILLDEPVLPASLTLKDECYDRSWPTATPTARRLCYEQLHPIMKRLDAERREALLQQLRQWANATKAGRDAYRAMSSEELKRLAASSWVTIGAHTVSHSRLSSLTDAQQREEIFASRQRLEELIDTSVTTFSYPFGLRDDYDRDSLELCKEAGFVRVAANFPGLAFRWTNNLQVPRHLVRNWDQETFVARLKEFWAR